MKVEIKLENPKGCVGCPFLAIDHLFGVALCGKKYEIKTVHIDTGSFVIPRPKECIEKNGK